MMRAQHPRTTHGERRMQKAALATRTRSLIAALLMTTLALGCTDSVPTAVEEHAMPEAAAAATLSNAKPSDTGVMRATFEDDEVCGIPVTTEFFRAGATWENPLPGNPPLKETGTLELTWTAANGKTVQLQHSGNTIREITEWIDEDEGIFRATETSIGRKQAIRTSPGPVLVQDVGRIVIGYLVQLQEGGGFTLLEPPVILEVSGPHPQGVEAPLFFCEIVTEALS